MRSMMLCSLVAALVGCRTAVVTESRDPNKKTVVTVEHVPTTNAADKGLEVHDKR